LKTVEFIILTVVDNTARKLLGKSTTGIGVFGSPGHRKSDSYPQKAEKRGVANPGISAARRGRGADRGRQGQPQRSLGLHHGP
jgi:hypothetical protein